MCSLPHVIHSVKIQLLAISFHRNSHISQTMLDAGDKRYKIMLSVRGRGVIDNSKGADRGAPILGSE